MLPLTPSQRLSQNKIAGQSVAWGRAQWGQLEDGSEGYVFPEGSFQLAQSLEHLRSLGLDQDMLIDCIKEFEDQMGSPEATQSSLGLMKNFGQMSPGLTVRSRLDDRLVCVLTPASWEVDKTEAYFEWYFDDQAHDMLARFDDLAGVDSVGSPGEMAYDLPHYDEACQRLDILGLSEAKKSAFLQKLWDFQKNLAPGFQRSGRDELLREWKAISSLKTKAEELLSETALTEFCRSRPA